MVGAVAPATEAVPSIELDSLTGGHTVLVLRQGLAVAFAGAVLMAPGSEIIVVLGTLSVLAEAEIETLRTRRV